ncbi:hypothetical protein J5X84_08850 [Streptosporangiaceae bacterium NEAU-GS5]|nr:hypothetical protein [Streptosporangiaceae bacterium NEAU-GS5]
MDRTLRVGGGLALVAAPVSLVASELLYVTTPDDPAQGLAIIQAHESAWLAANLLGLLAAALFVPAITLLAGLCGRVLAVTGMTLSALGVVGYAAHTGMFMVIGQLARQESERAAVARLLPALDGDPGGAVVLLMFLGGLYLGLVLLMIGAYRTRRAPLWAMICLVVAVLLGVVPLGVDTIEYAAEALVIAGLGGAGIHALRTQGAQPGTATRQVAPEAIRRTS